MKKISLYNHKGGVAKTTSVINIAYFLQKSGKTVLVADCDSQKNAFGFFFEQGKNAVIQATRYKNVSLTTWDKFADNSAIANDFDYCLFDCPPAMTDEVKDIIRNSDSVFVPTILGEFEIAGLQDVTEEIRRQGSKLGGVFTTMYTKKNDDELLKEFEQILKGPLMKTIIPYSGTVRESQKAGLSLEEYFDEKKVPQNPGSRKVALSYEALTLEILERSGENV